MMVTSPRLALLLAGALAVGPAPALAQQAAPAAPPGTQAVTVYLTPELIALCKTGHGCDVFHLDSLAAWVAEQMRLARNAGRVEGCKGTGT